MNDKQMYYDFATSMFKKLCEKVNGKIVYEIYKDLDAVIFKVFFKDFEYKYAVKDVTNIILSGGMDQVIEDLLSKYRSVLMRAFFKSKEKENYV